ncbi:enoyl-CoA hydratase/isomerase family protein [Oceanibacterium hippocampi]|uniref:2,3-dehydroadipyl-CoA hydratase n=1 Tax=Oceanibacterium hippocampi TaxID=745714 RepID=A0A1Y5SK62_9PROT|nr:enoyl-CoA hydratase/isomerase family protein [Oceanibacterium hippocampi]SLN42035.1 2,3-dehydroadipyl-CoA hydratase [Oceanibacterium hippocampi]
MGDLRVERRANGAMVLTLDSPAVRNALDLPMIRALAAALDTAAGDPDCRMVMLRGAGEDFCTGRNVNEIKAFGTRSRDQVAEEMAFLRDVMLAVERFPKPLVVAVDGYALGLGMALVGLADIALATERASFGLPEIRLGFAPSLAAVAALRAVDGRLAMPMLLTGERIDAAAAKDLGLVHRVVPAGELAAESDALSERLTALSTDAQIVCKRLVREAAGQDFATSTALAVEVALAGFGKAPGSDGKTAGGSA